MNDSMEAPKESGFNFTRVVLRELKFEDAGTGVPPVPVELDIKVGVDVKMSESGNEALVGVSLEVRPKSLNSYTMISAKIQGEFSATDEEARAKLSDFAYRQGAALLVPFIREVIANITARSRGGLTLLPPLNLYDLLDRMQAGSGKS